MIRFMGERPDVWLYIHGPSHQRALKAPREGSRLLTAAEKFATFDALQQGSFKDYPQAIFYKSMGKCNLSRSWLGRKTWRPDRQDFPDSI